MKRPSFLFFVFTVLLVNGVYAGEFEHNQHLFNFCSPQFLDDEMNSLIDEMVQEKQRAIEQSRVITVCGLRGCEKFSSALFIFNVMCHSSIPMTEKLMHAAQDGAAKMAHARWCANDYIGYAFDTIHTCKITENSESYVFTYEQKMWPIANYIQYTQPDENEIHPVTPSSYEARYAQMFNMYNMVTLFGKTAHDGASINLTTVGSIIRAKNNMDIKSTHIDCLLFDGNEGKQLVQPLVHSLSENITYQKIEREHFKNAIKQEPTDYESEDGSEYSEEFSESE